MELIADDGCLAFDAHAFQAYETHEALGDITPNIEVRIHRAITVHADASDRARAVHRMEVERAISPTYRLYTRHLRSPNHAIKIRCTNGQYQVKVRRSD